MKLSTTVSLLAPLACQAVAYTQNASIVRNTEDPCVERRNCVDVLTSIFYKAISGYQPYGVVEVPIVNTSIVPVTCTKFPFA